MDIAGGCDLDAQPNRFVSADGERLHIQQGAKRGGCAVQMTRREFVVSAAEALAAVAWRLAPIRAIAFDAFPIFDPRSVLASADAMYPGAGLSDEWRTRQFEYTWLRVAARRYVDFWRVTEDALVFAANRLKLKLSPESRATLMNEFLRLSVWPDVIPALESIRRSGIRLALLSNFTPRMLAANIANAGLHGMFEQVLSTDQVRSYKPDPRAYQMGVDALTLTRQEILFVAFAGWDAAGAKLFGYPTFWVNRQQLPGEEMGVSPDGSGETLRDLVTFLT
jgi:2-haloacid dehalogenase